MPGLSSYRYDAVGVRYDNLTPAQQSRYNYEGEAYDEGDEPVYVLDSHFH